MTKTIKERVEFAHHGGMVVRFHQHIGHRLNTDAQHSHGVAILTYFLSDGMPSANLLLTALTHDLAEQVSGDVPWTTKRRLGKAQFDAIENDALDAYDLTFPLTDDERRILSLADSLDGMLYCASEAALGNKTLHQVYYNWERLVLNAVGPLDGGASAWPHLLEVINAVIQIWKESNDAEGTKYTVNA